MFPLLSFSGRWDLKFLMKGPPPTVATEESKKATKDAVIARANYRYGRQVSRQPRWTLTLKQKALSDKYCDGTLLEAGNRLTKASGNGRLKLLDGGIVDIGGSTGGFARTVLYDWTSPDRNILEM